MNFRQSCEVLGSFNHKYKNGNPKGASPSDNLCQIFGRRFLATLKRWHHTISRIEQTRRRGQLTDSQNPCPLDENRCSKCGDSPRLRLSRAPLLIPSGRPHRDRSMSRDGAPNRRCCHHDMSPYDAATRARKRGSEQDGLTSSRSSDCCRRKHWRRGSGRRPRKELQRPHIVRIVSASIYFSASCIDFRTSPPAFSRGVSVKYRRPHPGRPVGPERAASVI
jgi:hypothetical protein